MFLVTLAAWRGAQAGGLASPIAFCFRPLSIVPVADVSGDPSTNGQPGVAGHIERRPSPTPPHGPPRPLEAQKVVTCRGGTPVFPLQVSFSTLLPCLSRAPSPRAPPPSPSPSL
ncbi:hypothetical protein E2C01_053817 [Portunus trituberculatus]|uniref:Uncharacterized protein n=1 Tax=Portunus trituberculatus TaxID=210409 RepID=A0A5B7GQ78_PORTR|nr:hypothetical protein [Portunus trituberculatus]